MNIHALSIGILVAIAIINLFNVNRNSDIQALYSLYLANFPIYFALFSLHGNFYSDLYQEILAGIPFILIAAVCYQFTSRTSMVVLASAYLVQASYAFAHASLFINSGVPIWWPEFSGSISLFLGIYLIIFIQSRSHQHTANNAYGFLQ